MQYKKRFKNKNKENPDLVLCSIMKLPKIKNDIFNMKNDIKKVKDILQINKTGK